MGRKDGAEDAVVHVSVHLGKPDSMLGYGFAVDIEVEGVDEEVLKAAYEVRFNFSFPLLYTLTTVDCSSVRIVAFSSTELLSMSPQSNSRRLGVSSWSHQRLVD
jgi:hypothetical protein